MKCLPIVGRTVVLLLALSLCLKCDPLWAAANEAKGESKAAVLNRSVRTGDPVQLLESLERRHRALEERAKWMDLREADLKRLEEKLAKRIVSLEQLREDLRVDLGKEAAANDASVARLAKIFSGMKVKAAASSLRSMDKEVAVLILRVMREKVAAKILSKMDSDDAVKLANEMGMPLSERKR